MGIGRFGTPFWNRRTVLKRLLPSTNLQIHRVFLKNIHGINTIQYPIVAHLQIYKPTHKPHSCKPPTGSGWSVIGKWMFCFLFRTALFFQIVNLNRCWQALQLDSSKDPRGFQLHIFAAMSGTGPIKASFWARVGTRKKVEKLSFQGSGDYKTRATKLGFMLDGLANIICWLCATRSTE